MDIQRVRQMEGYLKECAAATAELKSGLDRMEALKDPMTELFAYYGSEARFEDR